MVTHFAIVSGQMQVLPISKSWSGHIHQFQTAIPTEGLTSYVRWHCASVEAQRFSRPEPLRLCIERIHPHIPEIIAATLFRKNAARFHHLLPIFIISYESTNGMAINSVRHSCLIAFYRLNTNILSPSWWSRVSIHTEFLSRNT